ncbi:MAG: DUF177 domain-containing protein [Dehalococcoidia bacterium]
MLFNVSQLLRGHPGSTKSYDIEAEVDRPGEKAPVAIRGPVSLMRTDEGILVSATFHASIPCSCVRCLSAFEQLAELKVEEEYIPVEEVPAGPARDALKAESLIINEQHILDLEPALREYIILSAPMKALCRPDCAGLCTQCGTNLNNSRCSCPVRGLKTA